MKLSGLAILVSTVLLVFCAATLSGFLASAASGDWRAAEAFGLLSFAYSLFAGLTYIAVSGSAVRLNREQIFTAAILLWLTLILAATPAFIFVEHHSPLVAFYEAASAATTLGATLMPVEQMGAGMIAYRTMTAWLGGLLTIMLAIYVLGRYSVGGMPNRDLRFVLHGFSRGDPRIAQTFYEVFVPYLALTLICAAALTLNRVEAGQALILAMNIIATNGFTGVATGGSVLNNQAAEIILMIFMVAGATSIILVRALIGRRLKQVQDGEEAIAFLIAVGVVAILAFLVPVLDQHQTASPWSGLFGRFFDAISTMTTTGITHNGHTGFSLPVELMIGLALIGGGAYSTAGGLKMFRLRAMILHSTNEVKRLVFPDQVLPHSIDTDDNLFLNAKAIWSAFYAGLVLVVGLMVLFSIAGHDFLNAMALSVGAFSNVGNLVQEHLYVAEIDGIPAASLLLVSLAGIAGRVEVLVILAAFGRSRWA